VFVLLISPLVFVVDVLDLDGNLLDLVKPGIVHPFLKSVLTNELLNMDTGFLKVDF
jgi:hypothetical protein